MESRARSPLPPPLLPPLVQGMMWSSACLHRACGSCVQWELCAVGAAAICVPDAPGACSARIGFFQHGTSLKVEPEIAVMCCTGAGQAAGLGRGTGAGAAMGSFQQGMNQTGDTRSRPRAGGDGITRGLGLQDPGLGLPALLQDTGKFLRLCRDSTWVEKLYWRPELGPGGLSAFGTWAAPQSQQESLCSPGARGSHIALARLQAELIPPADDLHRNISEVTSLCSHTPHQAQPSTGALESKCGRSISPLSPRCRAVAALPPLPSSGFLQWDEQRHIWELTQRLQWEPPGGQQGRLLPR